MLALATLLVAAVAAFGTLLVALDRAQVQFDRLLEEKALSRAIRIRDDLQIAVDLGIPLAEIRGMYDYAEGIPNQDPDIRFVAVTDVELNRLHYGGIGRRRLDPLLVDPRLKAEADALLSGRVDFGDAVLVGQFAVTMVPIRGADGTPHGFVHVAVQARQLRERFGHEISRLVPLAALALLVVIELTGFAYGAGYRDPLARLKALLETAAAHDERTVLSGRHAGGDLGAAMFQFNAVLHRLLRRTNRLLQYAAEVRGAVFEPKAVAEIDSLVRATREEAAELSAEQLRRQADARRSDVRLPAVAAIAVGVLAVVWPFVKHDVERGIEAGAAAIVGLFIGAILRMPRVALAVTALALLTAAALTELPRGASWPLVALAAGSLGGLAVYYARRNGLALSFGWIALRITTGLALAVLALISGDRLGEPPVIAGIAVAAAALTLVVRAPVRRLLLGDGGGRLEGHG